MKYWSRKKIVGGSAPKPVTRIGLDLLSAIEPTGAEWPKLLRVGRHDGDDDLHRYEVDVELAPGLILPMEHGLTEEADSEWNDPSNDEEEVLTWTLEGIEACLPMLGRLADLAHDSRRRARAIVGRWREQGLPARVVDVHLAPYDHWRGDREPLFRVLLETLDENLEPAVEKMGTGEGRDLEATLDEAHFTLSARAAQRDALLREGATGMINQLALNAIGSFGDVAQILRGFRVGSHLRLADHTSISIRDGKVQVAKHPQGDFLFRPEAVLVSSGVKLRRDLVTAVGRPVTELIDHPFLSSDMSVLKAEWSLDYNGDRWLTVDLAMPWRLFCSTTGRVWDAVEVADENSNVVPFGRRRA